MTKLPKQIHYKHNRLQQLRGFCHVVQTGSISKAAERMFLSQPSVSLQIQALERELGVILFERNGPSLKLTPEGQTLYDLAQPLVDGMDNLYESFVDRYSNVDTGSLAVAAGPSIINYVIKDPIKEFSQDYPNVKLCISNMTWEESLRAVLNDEVDLAVTAEPEKKEGVVYQQLFSFKTVLILPRVHPLASADKITLEDVAKYPFVLPQNHKMTEHVFKQNKLALKLKVEVGGLDLVKRFVESGIGLSIVSSICLESTDNIVVREFSDYFPSRDYGILLRKGRFLSPQVKSFISILRSHEGLLRERLMRGHRTEQQPIFEVAG